MRSMFPRNLATVGKPFKSERTGISFKGILVLNQSKPRIDFENSVDVKSSDWIVNSAGERLYVTELIPISDTYKSCYYISEREYSNSNKQGNPTFSISATTIENSIIGTQASAVINLNGQIQQMKKDISESSSSDKEELMQIISLLEQLQNSKEPVPRGVLSKFSAVLERNSWITGSIAGFLLNLLLTL